MSNKRRTFMLKFLLPFFLFFSITLNTTFSQNKQYAGDINEDTIWQDTVYVTGNINMYGSLTIMPGTYVEFQGLYLLYINKQLIAEGTLQDSIRFAPKDRSTGWQGILFDESNGDSLSYNSKLSFCVFEYGKGFIDYAGSSTGGGICIHNWKSLSITNSSFRNNSVNKAGGAIYCSNGNLRLENCSLYSNKSIGTNSVGGAIYFTNSSAIIKNCMISSNYSEYDGGGLYAEESELICGNNIIRDNEAKESGAGLYTYQGNPVFTGNKFLNNSVTGNGYGGGGLFCYGNVRIEDNTFEGNSGSRGGALLLTSSGNSFIINNRFQKNKGSIGGAVYLEYSNSEITANRFFNNSASDAGGIYMTNCSPIVRDNLICNNSAIYDGGGVYLTSTPKPLFINNTIANNAAARGYAVFVQYGVNARFDNSIISGPKDELSNGLIYKEGWNSNLSFSYCNIQGNQSNAGNYNSLHVSDYIPGFVKPTQGSGSGFDGSSADWSLKGNSLCIDAGNPDTAGFMIPVKDLAGNKRIKNIIDIGAYEYQDSIINIPVISTRVITFFFNRISAGQRDINSFKIRNEGKGELKISSVSTPEGFEIRLPADSAFGRSIEDFIIRGGRDTTIIVSFHPLAPADYSGLITIRSNDTDNDSLSVPVSGTAISGLAVRGNITQSTEWAKKVYVFGAATIQKGVKVTIAPGTSVFFDENGSLNVQGSLSAVGTKTDSIKFIYGNSGSKNWQGINIDNSIRYMSTVDTTKLIFCSIEGTTGISNGGFSGGAVYINHFSSVIISKCNFRNNSMGAIYCKDFSSPLISSNTFSNNKSSYGGAITCQSSSSPEITDNIFNKNQSDGSGGAISCFYSSSPLISGNTFTNNSASYGAVIATQDTSNPQMVSNMMSGNNGSKGGVVFCYRSSRITLLNNIIIKNIGYEGGVIYIYGGDYQDQSFVTIINNTICNNRAKYCSAIKSHSVWQGGFTAINNIFYNNISDDGVQLFWVSPASPYIRNCDIKGGLSSVQSNGTYNNSTYYMNNIDADPLFVNSPAGSSAGDIYSLSSNSPCINNGLSDSITYNIPATDFLGKPRFAGSSIDIGALEYQGQVSVGKGTISPSHNDLLQNYPNPFNPLTTISYSIAAESYVNLKIYDMLGHEISTLINKEQKAGEYKVQFDGSSLPSGVYVYTIQAGQYRDSKKLLLLK